MTKAIKSSRFQSTAFCFCLLAFLVPFSSVYADVTFAVPRDWTDLISFRPSLEIQREVKALTGKREGAYIHRIENAFGAIINLDYYPILIKAMPKLNGKVLRATELKEYIRLNLDAVLDHRISRFSAYEGAENLERWRQGKTGAFGKFEIRLHLGGERSIHLEYGAVILTKNEETKWVFSTMYDGFSGLGAHPVSGNREFGITPAGGQPQGSFYFYTRAADRPTLVIDPSSAVFPSADKLWVGMQQRVKDWINSNGGSAEVIEKTQLLVKWKEEVSQNYWKPTTKWLD